MQIWLELTYGCLGEGVGNDLALAAMCGSVPDVEQTTMNRHEGVVEVAITVSTIFSILR